jgi:hypothetical protein
MAVCSKRKSQEIYFGRYRFRICHGVDFACIWYFAYLFGQPRWVWLRSGFFGLNDTVLFGVVYWIILKRYREAELRKSMSEDLTLGGNKNNQQN